MFLILVWFINFKKITLLSEWKNMLSLEDIFKNLRPIICLPIDSVME